MKPGYKTTEFWALLISYALSGFLGAKLTENEIQTLAQGASEIIVVAIPFIGTLMYLRSRHVLKEEALKADERHMEGISKVVETNIPITTSVEEVKGVGVVAEETMEQQIPWSR